MTKGRWGTDTPNDSTEARERLLDSAEACFSRFGLNKTTIDDVAAHAEVSRATVYRYFDGRDALVLGVLVRELSRFSEEVSAKLSRHAELPALIAELILTTIDAVHADKHLALLFAPHAAGITSEIAGAAESLFEMNADFLRPYLERAQQVGELRGDLGLDDLSEWVLRLTLSLLTHKGPKKRSREETRDFVMMMIRPVLTPSAPS